METSTVPVFLVHVTVGEFLIGTFTVGIGINSSSLGYSEEVWPSI